MNAQKNHSALQEHETIAEKNIDGKTELKSVNYEYKATLELIRLVKDASDLVCKKGEAAFKEFRLPDSRWRKGETYIFVLDILGNMLVHPDPELEGKNQLDLKDVNGKPIIRGLLGAATDFPGKSEGWYHYQWYVPGELVPRWKSSFVSLVKTPSGKSYVVGSGMYNENMERVFVVDMVTNAIREIEKHGKDVFKLFHDPTGPFISKNSYIFVIDMNAIELVNPAFPNLEGRNLLDLKDTQGKYLNREMLNVVKTRGSGWMDYMWPKPGESVSTKKSAYICQTKIGDQPVVVGCGVYLPDSQPENIHEPKISATKLMRLVHEAGEILKEEGERAYSEFRKKGSKWFNNDTYIFVFTLDGIRSLHAAEPESEGRNDIGLKDILGKPIVKMIIDAATSSIGEGWVHYMYPEPGSIFPAWKSSFVKRVTFPSGKEYIVGCGIYNMQMDKIFIEDVVNRASALVVKEGKEVFSKFRDKSGPFIFMDTYIFVESPDGTELVNPAQPNLEGRNLIDMKDLKGKSIIKEEITTAMVEGSGWVDLYWYQPGNNKPALKQTFVKKAQFGGQTYIVGSGLYVKDK